MDMLAQCNLEHSDSALPARLKNKSAAPRLLTRSELLRSRKFTTIPSTRSTFHTLCELEDPKIRRLLDAGPTLRAVSEKTGWHVEGTLVQLRQLMKDKLKHMLEHPLEDHQGAEPEPEEEVMAASIEELEQESEGEEPEAGPEQSALQLLDAYAPTGPLSYDDDGGDEFDILDDDSD
eukprot:TRINITY_DN16486_c0_g1_i2.p1 TRINITY_DN16486_c0_g1~~TRINITY_DN16486_c0_g1_i2.p1  ORF type:complete len:177 (-),score=69.97 TRINITY_DN16486_c0_g1_i2:51-581(-)